MRDGTDWQLMRLMLAATLSIVVGVRIGETAQDVIRIFQDRYNARVFVVAK